MCVCKKNFKKVDYFDENKIALGCDECLDGFYLDFLSQECLETPFLEEIYF
jgi:hypothetical protein